MIERAFIAVRSRMSGAPQKGSRRRVFKMSKLSMPGVTLGLGLVLGFSLAAPSRAQQLNNASLAVAVQAQDGSYQLATRSAANSPVLKARPGAQIDKQWVKSSDYPQHRAA